MTEGDGVVEVAASSVKTEERPCGRPGPRVADEREELGDVVRELALVAVGARAGRYSPVSTVLTPVLSLPPFLVIFM